MGAYLTNAIGLAVMTITLTLAALVAIATFKLFRRYDFGSGFVGVLAVLIILIVASALSRNLFVAFP